MKMSPVESSSVSAIGYDKATQELHVDFHGSGRYVYHNVPPEKYQAVMSGESIGKALHQHIKGQFPHRKA